MSDLTKFYGLEDITSSDVIDSFHSQMFHGYVEQTGESFPGDSHRLGERMDGPLEIYRNG